MSESDKPVKVALYGPLPPPWGGTTVSFNWLARDLRASPLLEVSVVATGADKDAPLAKRFVASLALFGDAVARARKADAVFLNGSYRRAVVLGALLAVAGAIWRKPVIVRVFGGNLAGEYQTWPLLLRWCTSFVFRRCWVLLQTKSSCATLGARFPHAKIVHFPTNRPTIGNQTLQPRSRTSTRQVHCVFASEVSTQKGLDVLLAAFETLGQDFVLDVFGPLRAKDGLLGAPANWPANVHYRGVAAGEQILHQLPQYDCLLLPSRCQTEGYPGAIVEALSAGVPVIASAVGGIPELVDETCGLLLASWDPRDWAEVLKKLGADRPLLRQLAEGASARGLQFSSAYWQRQFLPEFIRQVASGGRGR